MFIPSDLLILSNGPGEVTTWVRPVVKTLGQQLGENRAKVRISVVLSPCPNATGQEAAIAHNYPEVDRVLAAEHFWPFLLWGKTPEAWDWRHKGVVLFLGGDQFFTVILSKRLGYASIVYAEWDARWYQWIDCFGVMKPETLTKIPSPYRYKCTVVGDLMADVSSNSSPTQLDSTTELIALLPGSKPAKLAQGLPLCLAIAQNLHKVRTQTRFIIPVAPTLDLATLAKFADPNQNPVLNQVGGLKAQLITPDKDSLETPYLKTPDGLQIELVTTFPAYDTLSQCHLALTTVGANTAELGSLGVPMLVLLPTQQLDAMRSWDGLPGILARLPGLGSIFARGINWLVLRQNRLFAWPNIWATREIVPELVGNLKPEDIVDLALDFLENPHKLAQMRLELQKVRGKPGAAYNLVSLVKDQIARKS